MTFARHWPTQRFTRAAVAAMPDVKEGDIAPEGFSRTFDRAGKLLVIYAPPGDWRMTCTYRPIIVTNRHDQEKMTGRLEWNRWCSRQWVGSFRPLGEFPTIEI